MTNLSCDTQRLLNAFRLAIAYSLVYVLIMYHQGNFSYYIAITVGMVLLPFVGSTIRQSVLRIIGMLLGGFLGLLLIVLASYGNAPFMVVFFVITVVTMYFAALYTTVGTNTGYAFISCYLATNLVYFNAVQDKELADFAYLYRTWSTILGILIAVATVGIFWPKRSKKTLQQEMSTTWSETIGALTSLLTATDKNAVNSHQLDSILIQMDDILSQATAEVSLIRKRELPYRRWILLHDHLRTLIRSFPKVVDWSEREQLVLNDLARNIKLSGESLNPHNENHHDNSLIEKAKQQLNQLINLVGNDHIKKQYCNKLASIIIYFEKIQQCLLNTQKIEKPSLIISENLLTFSLDHYRLNKAIRAGFAAIVAIYTTMALDWPSGVLVVLFSALIAALASTKQTAVGFSLTVILSGWVAAGLVTLLKVFYFPHVERLPGLILAIFSIVVVLGYFTQGKSTIQRLLTLTPLWFAGLMLTKFTYNNSDLEPAYRTAQALSLGPIIGVLSHYLLWPTTEKTLACIQTQKFLKTAQNFINAVNTVNTEKSDREKNLQLLYHFKENAEKIIGEELKLSGKISSKNPLYRDLYNLIESKRVITDQIVIFFENPESRSDHLKEIIHSLDQMNLALKIGNKEEQKHIFEHAKWNLEQVNINTVEFSRGFHQLFHSIKCTFIN
jgi:uncharacterized membrane protein YccC